MMLMGFLGLLGSSELLSVGPSEAQGCRFLLSLVPRFAFSSDATQSEFPTLDVVGSVAELESKNAIVVIKPQVQVSAMPLFLALSLSTSTFHRLKPNRPTIFDCSFIHQLFLALQQNRPTLFFHSSHWHLQDPRIIVLS
jgi:hypothetical protein